jgi:hypothetical protein
MISKKEQQLKLEIEDLCTKMEDLVEKEGPKYPKDTEEYYKVELRAADMLVPVLEKSLQQIQVHLDDNKAKANEETEAILAIMYYDITRIKSHRKNIDLVNGYNQDFKKFRARLTYLIERLQKEIHHVMLCLEIR